MFRSTIKSAHCLLLGWSINSLCHFHDQDRNALIQSLSTNPEYLKNKVNLLLLDDKVLFVEFHKARGHTSAKYIAKMVKFSLMQAEI